MLRSRRCHSDRGSSRPQRDVRLVLFKPSTAACVAGFGDGEHILLVLRSLQPFPNQNGPDIMMRICDESLISLFLSAGLLANARKSPIPYLTGALVSVIARDPSAARDPGQSVVPTPGESRVPRRSLAIVPHRQHSPASS